MGGKTLGRFVMFQTPQLLYSMELESDDMERKLLIKGSGKKEKF